MDSYLSMNKEEEEKKENKEESLDELEKSSFMEDLKSIDQNDPLQNMFKRRKE